MREIVMGEINTEIIRRAQAGDAEMISKLYERYHLSIFRYLYYRVGDQALAEDLTSEVFVRMLRFIGGFNPPASSFQAWLFKIARNLSTDHFRKTKGQALVPLEEAAPVRDPKSDEVWELRMTSEHLKHALKKLNESQREVIILRFVAQMSILEVAQTLNKSEDAIKGLQRRALLALRDILTDGEVGDEF
jgi:RNA polymerase sigma-70 factor, ECF subfamily